MKLFTRTLFGITCSMLITTLVVAAEKDKDWTIYTALDANVILEKDDVDTWVGDASTRLTLGIQFTNSFALEIFGEAQSEVEPKLLYADVDRQFIGYRSLKTKGTQYMGGLGVFSIKPSFLHSGSLIAKVGVARYDTRRLTGSGLFFTEDDQNVRIEEREFDWSVKGFTPVIALGFEFPRVWKKMTSQLVFTHVFHEDIRSLSASCGIKYFF
ncbi:MAG: hypothetical protein F4039_07815 [Gammaproteobacteria bacterium]|nr:hypothetical protein [Gammaproteobacteria bacterium]